MNSGTTPYRTARGQGMCPCSIEWYTWNVMVVPAMLMNTSHAQTRARLSAASVGVCFPMPGMMSPDRVCLRYSGVMRRFVSARACRPPGRAGGPAPAVSAPANGRPAGGSPVRSRR